MRKIIVSMNVTLDGFMAGENCELDWHFYYWNEEMAEAASEQLSRADTILLGRVTYNAMAKYWPSKTNDLSFPREDMAFAEMMNSYNKIVFSNTLTVPEWHNSRLVKHNIRNEIIKLKQNPGRDIIIYGSGLLISALIQWGLIDEYALWIHPVVLGKGKSLFRGLQDKLMLELVKTKKFSSGVVIFYYRQA